MARRNSNFPRPIAPELICVGDSITVEYPASGGITVARSGIVADIAVHGSDRHFLTTDKQVIARYTPGFTTRASFTLNMRTYQADMLDMFTESGRI